MTRRCDGPLGAVRPLDAPSWLTAELRSTARIGWPLRLASDSRSSTIAPAPSPQLAPSAAAENDLDRPSAASAFCALNSSSDIGLAMTVTPPAIASVQSPSRRACTAQCIATSEDEQAVSIETDGPSNPSV